MRALLIPLTALTLVIVTLGACSETPPPREPERWQKRDARGKNVARLDGPWACVYDRETELLWEVKTENETAHHALASYSWFQRGLGVANAGSCADDTRFYDCDTADLIAASNAEALCGHSDWRLPSAAELNTLRSASTYPGETRIDSSLFPYLQRSRYWTADNKTASDGQLVVLSLHLGDDRAAWLPAKLAARAMLVRKASK